MVPINNANITFSKLCIFSYSTCSQYNPIIKTNRIEASIANEINPEAHGTIVIYIYIHSIQSNWLNYRRCVYVYLQSSMILCELIRYASPDEFMEFISGSCAPESHALPATLNENYLSSAAIWIERNRLYSWIYNEMNHTRGVLLFTV